MKFKLAILAAILCLAYQVPTASAQEELQSSKDVEKLISKGTMGDRVAQFNLGYMYYNADGVPQDHKEAFSGYRIAAEQG